MVRSVPNAHDESTGDSSSGTIRFAISKDLITKEGSEESCSPPITVEGMKWELEVTKSEDEKYLAVILMQTESNSEIDSVDVAVELKLINHLDDTKTITTKSVHLYNSMNTCWGREKFCIEDIMDAQQGFIKNNKLTVKARFWLNNRVGAKYSTPPAWSSSESKECPVFGTIRWEIDKDFFNNEEIGSIPIEVGGIQWAIFLTSNTSDNNVSVYLRGADETYEMQRVDVTVKYNLINHKDDSKSVITKSKMTYTEEGGMWGHEKFIQWDHLIEMDNGFIKGNKFTLIAEFSLSKLKGFRKMWGLDFTKPNKFQDDIALVIEGKKVYVGKQILSIHSAYFQRMFFGEFSENNQNEIELKDIYFEEFIELLNVIYPPFKKVTDVNVEYLLKLGDFFDVDWLLEKCEQFLIVSSVLNADMKLELAKQYRLNALQGIIVDNRQVETDFSLVNIEGMRKLRQADFANPNEPFHDIAFVFNGEKIHASKQILSIHSSYFLKIFKNKNKCDWRWKKDSRWLGMTRNEIELEDIDREEFLELLNVIYHPTKKITDENVMFLLRLAQKFDIEWIVDKCEQFLLISTKFTVAAKLKLATRYRLSVLQIYCFDQLETVNDIMKVKDSDDFKNLSRTSKAIILEKLLNF